MASHSATMNNTELRIVLLGSRVSGKSSSGNTILGRREFGFEVTTQCIQRHGEVGGRQVTVVDTPGWWRNISGIFIPELIKQGIIESISLSAPGPHVLLLVIPVDSSFKEKTLDEFLDCLKPFGEAVWCYTMVLFTFGDCLGDRTSERYIESEGGDLQWLVEKCGNRYHIFNNENLDDNTQVLQLLGRIDEMLAGDATGYFEIDKLILETIEKKIKHEEEKATQKLMKVIQTQESIRLQIGKSLHLSDIRIVLLGQESEGKSSSGNTILGKAEFPLRHTVQCMMRQGEVAGRHVTVIDTPGWRHHIPPSHPQKWNMAWASLCPQGPHVLLLHINMNISFPESRGKLIEGHMQSLGERAWDHCMLVFTLGDYLGRKPIEQYIESEGEALQGLVKKCQNRYHVLNNKTQGNSAQVEELLEKIEMLVADNKGRCYETGISQAKSINLPEDMGAEDPGEVQSSCGYESLTSTPAYSAV